MCLWQKQYRNIRFLEWVCDGKAIRTYVNVQAHASLTRAHVRMQLAHCVDGILCVLRTIAFGGLGNGRLDYVVVVDIRLHYKLDVFYNIATVTSCASSYCQRSSEPVEVSIAMG